MIIILLFVLTEFCSNFVYYLVHLQYSLKINYHE